MAVTPERVMQLGLGFWSSKTLLSAIELNVFTKLAKGPLHLDTLTSDLGLHPRGARDFFDALVALGMLERNHGNYSNSAEADLFLDAAKPSYLGGMLDMANERLYPFWGSLTEGLRTGLPQNEAKTGGPSLFENIYSNPDRLRSFLGAMTGLSMGAALAIAKQFPWRDYQTVVDVGGAKGGLLVQIARAHEHIHGTNFDLAVVEPVFTEYVAENNLGHRLKFQPGNFFEEELPRGDVITMGHILHDWDLDQKRILLKKAYRALPDGGAVIVFESLIDDDRRENVFGLLMSLNMLIETPGGFDYTGKECVEWMRGAGFRAMRVEHLVGPDSMVVGIK